MRAALGTLPGVSAAFAAAASVRARRGLTALPCPSLPRRFPLPRSSLCAGAPPDPEQDQLKRGRASGGPARPGQGRGTGLQVCVGWGWAGSGSPLQPFAMCMHYITTHDDDEQRLGLALNLPQPVRPCRRGQCGMSNQQQVPYCPVILGGAIGGPSCRIAYTSLLWRRSGGFCEYGTRSIISVRWEQRFMSYVCVD